MKKIIIFSLVLIYSGLLWQCQSEREKLPNKPLVSFKGKIVFQSDLDGDNEIYLLTKKGLKKLTNNTWSDEYPKWSPDGRKIVFTANPKGNYDIFVINRDGSNLKQLTSYKDNEITPVWLPDGNKVAFTEVTEVKGRSLREEYTIKILDLETMNIERAIPPFSGSSLLPNFSPSDPLMGFTARRTVGWDVAIYHFQKKEVKFLTEGGKACRSHFSRDGKKVAYVSSQADAKGDIWLMNPDGSEKTRLTRRNETYDYFPSWSADNKFIVFSSSPRNHKLRGDWALYLVKVDSKRVTLLLDTPGRDLFPDWH